MSRAVLSIGSNIGDRLAHLRSVVDALGERAVAVSAVYSTAPWGGVEQEDFLNAVVVAEDAAFGPHDWLRFGREREEAAERVRIQRWGPRSLDVDVVTCDSGDGEVRSDDPELILPHPRAHQRAFVLVPWLDVEPEAVLTADGRRLGIGEWLGELDAAEREGVHRTDLTLTGPTTQGHAEC
ncbi:2-amino-4-hydroxy-6-hydroxymethyldihydropteridinediphosphokinase [Rhodococcus rhodochrous J3]|uniref:2-amino-4-hydroxy-6-hydroxymethyldihydropteridine diphosphokinase n=2 Tax=Rhodococcus rhodochrous TaxID=1829 RepID=A0AA46WWB6_RHORH|nr:MULTISPECIES: 2-amino-4-hydroxy-6-hydroxymethyldihydropteridine diphosphokinase [Rhodococcus]AYA24912.1 2-amino-4-hydroxy-6-hydroxymethyldihydropteridine diphosphokinase [Rhodococcus rhodochrous]MBF4477543.1 2-amino-4-hydroxy-6-hydroxymethyldihydropteridine diphosphokinase [Rhodococcus rhodochrous]MCD2097940.1 2-amino-4-hydroxy-6-hydroxymethyldihydropteridine diphosphokinase [Rhodococcus rhodochrous]MCD2122066.1 2-amino-4-hydroxy-6-hydroxymethyldihydropteridine diphosphokinase [Rhodococcus r